MSSVYEPREDSDLLARYVRLLARGRVLDMGTGSGVQAFIAAENSKVKEITAVDINPLAIVHVARRIETLKEMDPRIRSMVVLQSDMFDVLDGQRFDTIICNPPYLPDEEKDTDPALYGGPQGYEFAVKFLAEAKEYLAPGGQILFLFSSLTNRDRIDMELKRLGYLHEELAQLAEFFERLYVYRIWLPERDAQ
jgi:release factor glutamine methyltransferase